ncbi:hypothetical protein COU01_01375 [Candidatus Falkowbacteria bacterium CG10_big_fil_rev_8_21_14_0_10_44_15]|uniref:Glycosyl transferase family 1 domain-containing protein n=1 Tax=Candidatus Falkowbacteria bacterium CG10_big_fil_rev_8_21_14_0_10_44_15 TaxID=1974569 RepID=A0A2H0V095_9BACT|nr:MAG: hypothetical protein COU01_01375 [Candidatus Falkowbacteria bacterium CG10_big_fil_rev_8_21_14_0_10_44_15]
MKILSISLDKNILDKDSAAAKRMVEYGNLVERYTILVLADRDQEFGLSDKVKVIAIRKSNKFFSLLKLKRRAAEVLNSENYNIITVQDAYFIGLIALKLAKKFHLGLEAQVHGFEKFSGARKLLAKKVLRNADAVRVVSQRLKRQLISDFGVAERKITVVPIYSEHRTCNTQHITYTNDKFIFLTVGRLVPVKNVSLQIKAMRHIVKQFPQAELWIVGDGEQRQALEELCYPLPVTRYVKFFGWQENVEKFYRQADVFLLTSNSEGWGLAVVEAAAQGLPIIMTGVGLAGEVIKDKESGIVIPVGDQKELEKAMAVLTEDQELREKLGRNAAEVVKKFPSKEETLALYKKSWQTAVDNKI